MCQLIGFSQHAVLLNDLIKTGLEARARSAVAPCSWMSRTAQLTGLVSFNVKTKPSQGVVVRHILPQQIGQVGCDRLKSHILLGPTTPELARIGDEARK